MVQYQFACWIPRCGRKSIADCNIDYKNEKNCSGLHGRLIEFKFRVEGYVKVLVRTHNHINIEVVEIQRSYCTALSLIAT